MNARQGGFLISKIKNIGGRSFKRRISTHSTARRAKYSMFYGRTAK